MGGWGDIVERQTKKAPKYPLKLVAGISELGLGFWIRVSFVS